MQLKRGIAMWLMRASLCALFLSSGAASAAIIEDERALEAALEDGFYSLAEQSIRELLTRDVSSAEAEQLQLLLSHALYGQQKYKEIKRFQQTTCRTSVLRIGWHAPTEGWRRMMKHLKS